MYAEDIIPYINQMVTVRMKSGERFTGVITSTSDGYDTRSGMDEAELFTGEDEIGLVMENIESIRAF